MFENMHLLVTSTSSVTGKLLLMFHYYICFLLLNCITGGYSWFLSCGGLCYSRSIGLTCLVGTWSKGVSDHEQSCAVRDFCDINYNQYRNPEWVILRNMALPTHIIER